MIIELSSVQQQPITTDVCIIGAGIAGLTVARELLGAPLRVLVVESGGLASDDGANALNKGDNGVLEYFSTEYGRTRGLGGTSELWAGQCTPMDAVDFDVRPWVPGSGWPISRSDLQPFYPRALGVFALPPDALEESRTRDFPLRELAVRFDGLVMHASSFSSNRYLGRELRQPLETSETVSVLLHATATQLLSDPGGLRVERLEVRSMDGCSATVRAGIYVLAAGAIENARLMLLSKLSDPRGVGNRHGLVGQYLQDHVIGSCAVLEGADLGSLWKHADLVRRDGMRWSSKLRMADSEQAKAGVLNCTASLVFDFEDKDTVEHMVRMYRAIARRSRYDASMADLYYVMSHPLRVIEFGARHLGYTMPRLIRPKSVNLSVITEQAPNPDSRVTLSASKDELGLPRVKVEWRLGSREFETFRAMAKLCKREFERAGLAKVSLAAWLAREDESWTTNVRDILHCSGTTRMGVDPKSGVVDSDCKVFDTDNLYVAGSSVFPTSGHANPVLTSSALAIRLADHLKARLARGIAR